MRVRESISTAPIGVDKSIRADEIRALTSCRAGNVVPVAAIPLLREDRVSRGSLRLQLKMDETIHPLMNAINVTAYAHFVPFLAFERFQAAGMDAYNRSYQGVPEPTTGQAIPYFTAMNYSRDSAFWRALGIHAKQGASVNAAYCEAYNEIVNFRRKARSKHLPLRTPYSHSSLAQAFWRNPQMAHIVPDFDDVAMDGDVELQFTDSLVPVRGIGKVTSGTPALDTNAQVWEGGVQGTKTYPHAASTANTANGLRIRTNQHGTPAVFAELREAGVKLSLANIELAKKTAAFAKLRDQYSGLDDDHIIDLLMEGIRVPDEAMKQPILLDRKSTIFGYSERHATDGDNLDKSVTTGTTEMTLNFRTPPMNVQGVIIVTVEIVPEQLYERQQDHFLGLNDPDRLPNFLRDYLDPQKVEIVQNQYVDVEHSTPTGTFGYAPLNHAWKRSLTRIGGKYMRPAVDTFIEDRQRFWSMERANPALTTDFYLCPPNLPHTVFADMLSDPFEILTLGRVEVVGNTVFGKVLEEDENHYDSIMEQVDTTRIKGTPVNG